MHSAYCNVLPTARLRGPHGVRPIPIPHSSRLAVNLLGAVGMGTLHLSRLTVNLLEMETSGYPHSSRLAVNLLEVEA